MRDQIAMSLTVDRREARYPHRPGRARTVGCGGGGVACWGPVGGWSVGGGGGGGGVREYVLAQCRGWGVGGTSTALRTGELAGPVARTMLWRDSGRTKNEKLKMKDEKWH